MYFQEDQWVIWNSAYGICDTVTIAPMQTDNGHRDVWLEEPYEMAGPFSLDELEKNGQVRFAACIIMSREKWQENQVSLRHASLHQRAQAQKDAFEELNRANARRRKGSNSFQHYNEKEYRKLLKLPTDEILQASKIKAAFRKLAKEAHPDVGGTHEEFVRITEARDILLGLVLQESL